ncbi:hypothetical protein [Gloeothece citriformis]|nr:hypothetical protein [Gloeothece citriformis]
MRRKFTCIITKRSPILHLRSMGKDGHPLSATEVEAGFTVEEWEGFDVKIIRIERDEQGNIIEVDDDLPD